MTHFADGVRVGYAGESGFDTRAPIVAGPGPTYYQPGAGQSTYVTYDIVPLAQLNNNLATSQTVSNTSFVLAAGTGVTSTTITINGTATNYLALDVPRAITASNVSSLATSVAITVVGLDTYLQPMTQTFSSPTATAAATTSKKAFAYVSAASTTGNTTSGITLGTADIFGLPHRFDAVGYVHYNWDNTWATSSAGVVVADTATPSATTGDVRGTVAPTSTSNGTRRLVGTIFNKNTDTINAVYGLIQA